MRTTSNQYDILNNFNLINGYDYINQAWVIKGIYQKCGHPENMDCNCYGKINQGKKCEVTYEMLNS